MKSENEEKELAKDLDVVDEPKKSPQKRNIKTIEGTWKPKAALFETQEIIDFLYEYPEKIQEAAEKFDYFITDVYTKMRYYQIYGVKKITNLLDKKTDEEIAKEGHVSVEAVARIRKEVEDAHIPGALLNQKILEYIYEYPDDIKKVAQTLNISETNVISKMKENNIYNATKIRSLLDEKTDEEISAEGNVSIIAVSRIREKEKEKGRKKVVDTPKNKETKKSSSVKKQNENTQRRELPTARIIQLGKNLVDVEKIAEETGVSSRQVSFVLKTYGIYSIQYVTSLLNKLSDKEIAEKGKLNVLAVSKLRKEKSTDTYVQESKKQKENTNAITVKNEKRSKAKKSTPQENSSIIGDKLFLEMAKRFEPVEKIANTFKIDNYEVLLKLEMEKIRSRAEVERLIEKSRNATNEKLAYRVNGDVDTIANIRELVEKRERLIASVSKEDKGAIISSLIADSDINYISERYSISKGKIRAIAQKYERDKYINLPEDRRRVLFKNDFNTLRYCLQKQESLDQTKRMVMNYNITKILVTYQEFLQRPEYALLTYGYMKIGEYYKAAYVAKQYLKFKKFGIKEMAEKINDILEQEKNKQSISLNESNEETR